MANTMNRREELSDEIYKLLVTDEASAIQLWKENQDELKLKKEHFPKLDILTCVYNAEAYIAHAIESIILQSYINIHLVIVTDPCTDNTISIIQNYCEKYVQIELIQNSKHEGIISCFNKGLEHCKSDYIARMDLDDLIHPMRFEKQMNFLLDHPEVGAVSSWMHIFNEKKEKKLVEYRDDFDLQKITLLFYSPISHAASIFRAKTLQDFKYREEFKYAEDYDLWFRIMGQYKTAVYPESLYLYRTHSNQVTNARNLEIIKGSWYKILENLFNGMQVSVTETEIQFHIEYVLLNKEIENLEVWNSYHSWIEKLILANKASGYFNQKKLIQFIHTNYWLSKFNKFKKQMSKRELIRQINSEVFNSGIKSKIKEVIKSTIR